MLHSVSTAAIVQSAYYPMNSANCLAKRNKTLMASIIKKLITSQPIILSSDMDIPQQILSAQKTTKRRPKSGAV